MASSQATSMDDGGGVVLSAIALRHLEVEKANLRFKLADAEKQSELRHGQVAAYESKIQDLLLLVEMNKKVAAEALKCSTNTAHKLEEANEQLERWQARGMASLARRRRRRHLAQVLATLQCHAGRMRSWCRILTHRRQAALRLAFVRWNIAPSRHAAPLSVAVPSFHVPSQRPTSVVRSLDALQHCLEKQALALVKPLRRNVFSSWKGSLSTTRGQEYTAQVWHKRQLRYLLRRVWLVWTTHVSNRATCRRANRRQRLRLRWQRWVKYRWVQVRRRYLIVKIVDGHRRRQMVQCYVRWQLQSKNDQIATWLTCLEGAKIALAEERSACAKQKADVEAHLEHQTAAEHERHRAIGNHIDLCLRFLRWGGYVRLQHRVNVLAYQHATQRTAQLARKLLFRWRRMRHLRQTSGQFSRQFKAQNLRRYARQVLFQWWRLCRRTKLLGRLTTKRTRAMLAAGLSKLVAGSVRRHKEQQLQLHLKYSHVHSDLDLKLEQNRRQCQASQTASYMAYVRQRNYLRGMFIQWGRCLLRRRLLKRLLCHVADRWRHLQHHAWTIWASHTVQAKWTLIWGRACVHQLHATALRRPFAAWTRRARSGTHTKRNRFYMQSALALWRVSIAQRRTQVHAAGELFRALHVCVVRRRFETWRRKVSHHNKLAQFHRHRHHQTVRRMFHNWRKFAWVQCHISIFATDTGQARASSRNSHRLMRRTFQAWYLWRHHVHTQRAYAERSLRRGLFGWQWSHVQAFSQWKSKVHRRLLMQTALARIIKRHKLAHKGLAVAWTRWMWSIRVILVCQRYQRQLRVASREVKLAHVDGHTDTLVSTCWTKWRYGVLTFRKQAHYAQLMTVRHQRQDVTKHYTLWIAYHIQRRRQVAWLRQWARHGCTRTLASALRRWQGHSHTLLERQYEQVAVAANKTLAVILITHQRNEWQRAVLQAWNRHTRLGIQSRHRLFRRLCGVAKGQLRRAWQRWLATPSPARTSSVSRLLQQHWDQRRIGQSFRGWHRLARSSRQCSQVLGRLACKLQGALVRRGLVRWQLATAAARQGLQRAKFAAYTGKQSDGLRQCLHLQWYWHRWYRHHLTIQDQRRQWSHRQDICRHTLMRRCMLALSSHRALRWRQVLALRGTCQRMRRVYLALAMSSWRRKVHGLSLIESTARSAHDLKRAKHTVAHLLFVRFKLALVGRCLVAWRKMTAPRRVRMLRTWSTWIDVLATARHASRIRTLRTLATRFHGWKSSVALRHHQRQRVRFLAARRYRRGILRGFHTWHRLVRRSMHEECLQRVAIIEDMVATQTLVLDTLNVLRPMVHRWRQAVVHAHIHRHDVAECQHSTMQSLWGHWASYSRRRRRVAHNLKTLQSRLARHVLTLWCRWQRRWTAVIRALRACVVLSIRRRLRTNWARWLKTDQQQVALASQQRLSDERLRCHATVVRFQRSALRCTSLAMVRTTSFCLRHVWTEWTRLVRMRRWWHRKRTFRHLRTTWQKWNASLRAERVIRLKDMWGRWHTAAVRGLQDRSTRHKCVDRWTLDRCMWFRRIVWRHWTTFTDAHTQWRRRQVVLGRKASRRALQRRVFVAWRHMHMVAADVDATSRRLLGLVVSNWRHAAKRRSNRRAKSQHRYDQTMALCRYIETYGSRLVLRLPTVFLAWKNAVVFSTRTLLRPGQLLRHKVAQTRQRHAAFASWAEYVRGHRRRRAASMALLTKSKDRTTRWKVWHAWSLHTRDKHDATTRQREQRLRRIWRSWADSTSRRAHQVHGRDAWSAFVYRLRTSMLTALSFHAWRQCVHTRLHRQTPADYRTVHSGASWRFVLRKATDIAIAWQRRQVRFAWWRWVLHAKGIPSDNVLDLDKSTDAAAAVAHWTWAQWKASVLHARRQQRWLMAFFTKTCHVQQLRRRFVRWKKALSATPQQLLAVDDDHMQQLRVAAGLRRCFVSCGFIRWKAWYIHEALAEAETEHALLMDALQDIASYRMSL